VSPLEPTTRDTRADVAAQVANGFAALRRFAFLGAGVATDEVDAVIEHYDRIIGELLDCTDLILSAAPEHRAFIAPESVEIITRTQAALLVQAQRPILIEKEVLHAAARAVVGLEPSALSAVGEFSHPTERLVAQAFHRGKALLQQSSTHLA